MNGDYIAHVFLSQLGEVPRMGWFIPPDRFLARVQRERLVLYSREPSLPVTPYVAVLDSGERRRVTQTYAVACDPDTGELAVYRAPKPVPEPDRAFFTTKPPQDTRVGLASVPLSVQQQDAVLRWLGWLSSDTLHLSEAVGFTPDTAAYSIHALYDPATRSLVRAALVVHNDAGTPVAYSVTDSTGFMCDGCGLPTHDDGPGSLYRVLNLFRMPGFVHPLLLLDTGTIEGRAVSLLTFTPDGQLSEFRDYEYVVGCILGNRP
jgi:hypothetical protein